MRLLYLVMTACLSLAFAAAAPSAASIAQDPGIFVRWIGRDGAVLKELTLARDDLVRMQQVSFLTRTFWKSGRHAFTGPSLNTIAALGPGPVASARIVGLDGYRTDLDAREWTERGMILALWLDGQHMRVRDLGPFWLVFPSDSDPATLFTQEIQEKQVWHVSRIEFHLGQ